MARPSRLSALRLIDRIQFEAEVSLALSQARGNVSHAALALRTSHRTMRRLLASEPSLDAFAAELRRKHQPGGDRLHVKLHDLCKQGTFPDETCMTIESQSATIAP